MKKFTLIELLVIVAIIGILISILLPSMYNAKQAAMVAVCLSNASQHNLAAELYTKENNDRYHPVPRRDGSQLRAALAGDTGDGSNDNYKWYNSSIRPYNPYLSVSGKDVFMCPTMNGVRYYQAGNTYAFAYEFFDRAEVIDSAKVNLFKARIHNPSNTIFGGNNGAMKVVLDLTYETVDEKFRAHDSYFKTPLTFFDGHVRFGTVSVSARSYKDYTFDNRDNR